jgi:hypothetical protein
LLRAVEGLRNWRAVLLSIVYLGVALLIAYLGVKLALNTNSPEFFLKLFFVLAAVVAYLGVSAVGLTLIDQAQGLPSRPLLLAVWDSFAAALRVLAVALIGAVVVLIFYVLMALVLFICKLPGLGPVLYAVAFPVLVIVGGLLLFSISAILTMAGPAVWNGASIRGAVAMLWQIATKRTVELLISLVLLALLSGLVGAIVFAIIASGFVSVVGFSAAILDFNVSSDVFNLLGVLQGRNSYGGQYSFGNLAAVSDIVNYLKAAAFGSSVVLILVISALNATVLLGLNLIYLKLSADLDPSETERLIGQRLTEAREKAQALKEESQRRLEEAKEIRRQQQEAAAAQAAVQAQTQAAMQAAAQAAIQAQAQAAAQAAAAAPVAPAAPAANAQPAAALCPKCQAPIIPGDLFCGECGHKLG